MITGITILALAFWMPELRAMETPDFERLLPMVLTRDVPAGVVGLLLAGLLAAFMSNFAATINAAPAYIVNDIYKRFINPNTTPKAEVAMSRFASLGSPVCRNCVSACSPHNILDVMMWIVGALVRRLRDRQRVEMVLVAIQRLRLFLGNVGRRIWAR